MVAVGAQRSLGAPLQGAVDDGFRGWRFGRSDLHFNPGYYRSGLRPEEGGSGADLAGTCTAARCEECITGVGQIYTYIIPKHKSGHNVFVEMLRLNESVMVGGPAARM